MNRYLPIVALVVLGGLWAFTKYSPEHNPLRPDGPDMVTAFTKGARGTLPRQDASQFAALCQSLHDKLAEDWEQSKPYITTGSQVDTLRVVSRRVLSKDSFVEQYPALKEVLEQHFIKHVGDSGGPLTDDTKAGWLKAYQELADSTKYAADNL